MSAGYPCSSPVALPVRPHDQSSQAIPARICRRLARFHTIVNGGSMPRQKARASVGCRPGARNPLDFRRRESGFGNARAAFRRSSSLSDRSFIPVKESTVRAGIAMRPAADLDLRQKVADDPVGFDCSSIAGPELGIAERAAEGIFGFTRPGVSFRPRPTSWRSRQRSAGFRRSSRHPSPAGSWRWE